MEGFCRGCLIKYNEPMELLQYTEKNRRLFVYSTGLQVKRNDAFTFQLCKDCFLNMKQACKFKKQCRTSDKRFRNYLALKDVADPMDFCTFLKNSDDTLTFRLPMISGNSTPATQKCRDDDNESTCTSIRNFMTDILEGEEMPDTEARIIKEVIEEEADVLDDSLDSHWMQDDMSIDTDFRLDFSFSPFSTPHSVNNDRCYTPKQTDEQVTFDTINTKKQTKILNDFTNAFKSDENITERNVFDVEVTGISKTEEFKNIKELCPFDMEIDGMDTSDSKTNKSDQNLKELFNFGKDEVDGIDNPKSNQSLKRIISELDVGENDVIRKSESNSKNNRDIKELFDFSLDDISGVDKAESKVHKNVQSLKELCDFSLDSIGSSEKSSSNVVKKNQNLKELYDISLNSFDETAKSVINTFQTDRNVKEIYDFGINEINGIEKSESNIDLPLLHDVLEKDRIDTPDFDIPKDVIGFIQSSNDMSNSSTNIEALLKDKPCTIDKNLEKALKNTDNKEFSLEDIIVSPPEFLATSAASTPTITNILFGEKLDTPDIKLTSYHDVECDIEIFEEFFQNDTKEFDLQDIKKEKERYKSEDESKNVDMDISFGDKDQADNNNDAKVTKFETETITHFSDPNDKFDIENLYCKLCEKKYNSSRALCVHSAKTHNIKIIMPKKSKKPKDEAKVYITDTSLNDNFDIENRFCKLCKRKFKSLKALTIHLSVHHKIKITNDRQSRNNQKLCNHCGKIWKDPTNYAAHVKICQANEIIKTTFKCDRCQAEFTSENGLERHKICHTHIKRKKTYNEKEYVCSFCGAIFHKQANLMLHMRRHTKEYSARCELCDKGFYRQSDLKNHMRNHTGETPFACKFCPISFARRDVLTRHVLLHLGEKFYECDYCNRSFVKKWDLIKHLQRKCSRENRLKKKKINKISKENKDIIPIDKEQEVAKEVTIIYTKGKKKKNNKTPKKNKDITPIEKEQEVEKEVTILDTNGSDATINNHLPFLETERNN